MHAGFIVASSARAPCPYGPGDCCSSWGSVSTSERRFSPPPLGHTAVLRGAVAAGSPTRAAQRSCGACPWRNTPRHLRAQAIERGNSPQPRRSHSHCKRRHPEMERMRVFYIRHANAPYNCVECVATWGLQLRTRRLPCYVERQINIRRCGVALYCDLHRHVQLDC